MRQWAGCGPGPWGWRLCLSENKGFGWLYLQQIDFFDAVLTSLSIHHLKDLKRKPCRCYHFSVKAKITAGLKDQQSAYLSDDKLQNQLHKMTMRNETALRTSVTCWRWPDCPSSVQEHGEKRMQLWMQINVLTLIKPAETMSWWG